jgi:hypothetical protein
MVMGLVLIALIAGACAAEFLMGFIVGRVIGRQPSKYLSMYNRLISLTNRQ